MSVDFEKYLKIFIAVLIPNLGAWIFSIGVFRYKDWYKSLKQPRFTVPRWLFGPAWLIIYCCIGFASYLVFEDLRATGNGFDKTALTALALYIMQMIFNWIWIRIFFKYHSLLWVCIIITWIGVVFNCNQIQDLCNRAQSLPILNSPMT